MLAVTTDADAAVHLGARRFRMQGEGGEPRQDEIEEGRHHQAEHAVGGGDAGAHLGIFDARRARSR